MGGWGEESLTSLGVFPRYSLPRYILRYWKTKVHTQVLENQGTHGGNISPVSQGSDDEPGSVAEVLVAVSELLVNILFYDFITSSV